MDQKALDRVLALRIQEQSHAPGIDHNAEHHQKQIELEQACGTQQRQRQGHAHGAGIGKAETIEIDTPVQGIAARELVGNGYGDHRHRRPQEATHQHQLAILSHLGQLEFRHIVIDQQCRYKDHSDQTGNACTGTLRQDVQPVQTKSQHHEHQDPGHFSQGGQKRGKHTIAPSHPQRDVFFINVTPKFPKVKTKTPASAGVFDLGQWASSMGRRTP